MRTANRRPAFAGNDNGAPKGMKRRTGRSSFDRVQIKPSLLFRQWRALTGPCQQGVQCRAKRLPPVREAVFHLGWHLIMDDPAHDTVFLHLAQLLDQHLLRDGGNRAFKRSEERRGGKECVGTWRSRWSQFHKKKKK